MISGLAPVVLFTYNRPSHTKQLLDSLAANPESEHTTLYIYCDGPRESDNEGSLRKISETRQVARSEKRFKEVIVKEQVENKGLANSVIDGVTEVIDKHGTAIVLEDDLVLSPFFLYYMNDSLVRYEHNSKVGQIGACNFFACGEKYPTTFFLPIPDCLGWATWKNRWDHFTSDAKWLLHQIEANNLLNKFNVYGSYDMKGMLVDQMTDSGTSWAVRWTAVCILNNWLTLYPNPSLTNHIASDNATNANLNILPPMPVTKPQFTTVETVEIPGVIEAMRRTYAGVGDYYGNLKTTGETSFFQKIGLGFISKILRKNKW